MSNKNPEWDNLETQISGKRRGDKNNVTPKTSNSGKISLILSREEITVQRLSSELNGKTNPKYRPIGAREFVVYSYPKLVIENIKISCYDHFKMLDKSIIGTVCDILATDRGPSCRNLDQLPNLNVIFVRFVEKEIESKLLEENPFMATSTKKLKITSTDNNIPVEDPSISCPPTFKSPLPKTRTVTPSISLSTMLGLGQVIKTSNLTILLQKFDIEKLSWSAEDSIQFCLPDKEFAQGGFRKAFKGTSSNKKFASKTWVIKRFKKDAVETISQYKQTVEQQTRKVVQMHTLAGHFARKLASKANELSSFGNTFSYLDIYFGTIVNSEELEYVTIEEYISGDFTKYLNNTGDCNSESQEEHFLKAECLAHYTFEKSDENLLLTDIQGFGFKLCDPEIASINVYKDDEALFGIGNLSRHAIKKFGVTHKCNQYCTQLSLREFSEEYFQEFSTDLTSC